MGEAIAHGERQKMRFYCAGCQGGGKRRYATSPEILLAHIYEVHPQIVARYPGLRRSTGEAFLIKKQGADRQRLEAAKP